MNVPLRRIAALLVLGFALAAPISAQELPAGMSKGRFDELCAKLKDPEKWTRISGLAEINRDAPGHPCFEAPVTALLKDPEEDVRVEAAKLLGQMTTATVFNVLLTRVREEKAEGASYAAVKGMETVFRKTTPKDQEPIRATYLTAIWERIEALAKQSADSRSKKGGGFSGFVVIQHCEEYVEDLSKDFDKRDAAYVPKLLDLLMRADADRLPLVRADPVCKALLAIGDPSAIAGLEKAAGKSVTREGQDADAIHKAIERLKPK